MTAEPGETGLRHKVIHRWYICPSMAKTVSDTTSTMKQFNLNKRCVVFAVDDTKDEAIINRAIIKHA